MPSAHDPGPAVAGGEPVVVVPEATARRRTEALLAVCRWLADDLGAPPTVVCWQGGPLVDAFGAVAPVIDAAAVNEELPARALGAVGLLPAARAWKHLRLRGLLRPLAPAGRVLLGGPDTLPLVEWLPRRPGREVAVWLGDEDLASVGDAVRAATAFVAAGDEIAEALLAAGVAERRLHRVAEPLVAPAGPPADGDLPAGRPCVAVLGAGTGDEQAVPALVAAVAATAALDGPSVLWVQPEGAQTGALWTDPRFAGLEARVVDGVADDVRRHRDGLVAVVQAGPAHAALAVEAAVHGVPVLALGPTGGVHATVVEPDATRLGAHLTELVADPARRAAARDETRRRARLHRVDEAGRAVLSALSMAAP
ncbi:MAG: hypothetical protein KDB10_20210 [Acidimicrobiales bacterium]|nr:hypothetical protein [Acidimicrobiales bacterium]